MNFPVFSDKENATECTLCAAGTYNNKKGQAVCAACEIGTYNDKEGQKKCSACAIGTFAGTTASTECTACSAGSFAATTGSSECSLCAAGSFSGPSASTCALCAAGTISDAAGSAECKSCAAGTSTGGVTSGAVECDACLAGQYSSAESVSCSECAAGSYAGTTGSAECSPCPAGSFASETASTECTLCAPASFTDKTGQSTCASCTAGTYTPYSGSVTCAECEPGTVSPPMAISCSPCSIGSHASASGSDNCDACAPGTFADREGSADCSACSPGTSTDGNGGATECAICDLGSYAEGSGNAGCSACPSSMTSTTYSTGSTSPADCIGPVLVAKDGSEATLYTMYDAANINNTLGEIASLVALSGDWKIRFADDPNEVMLISNGESLNLGDTVVYTAVPDMVNVFCYVDTEEEGHGVYFRGNQVVDQKGNKCLSPCRNEAGAAAGPTCQVLESEGGEAVESVCGIPTCVWDVQCYAYDGVDYRGNVSTSESGSSTYNCQSWDSNWPHYHSKFHPSPENAADFGVGAHSHCRNPDPDNAGQPWCYTTNVFTRVGFCTNIARCEDSGLPIFSQ